METNTNNELEPKVPEKNVPETNVPETAETGETPETGDGIPENTFLIIEGVRVLPLKEPVINIGRRLDNHVVIDDPRISRHHIQLRALRGHYVLFDLNSTGGTFVNGQRTTQTVLYPDDEISLAGVILVFGQNTQPTDLVDTLASGEPESDAEATITTEISTVDIEAVSNEHRKKAGSSDPEAHTLDT